MTAQSSVGSPDLKDRLFVPLSTHYLDDDRIGDVSLLAQQLYIRSLLVAKRSATDGTFHLRNVAGGLYGAVLAPGMPAIGSEIIDQAAKELDAAALWESFGDGTYLVVAFMKHNGGALALAERNRAQALALGERKSIGAHKTNHGRGLHKDSPRDGCPLCEEEHQARALDSANGQTALSASATDSGAIPHLTSPHLTSEVKPPPPRSKTQKEAAAHELAGAVKPLLAAGHSDFAKLYGQVLQAGLQGWPDAEILAVAEAASTKAHPPSWFATVLANPRNRPDPELSTADALVSFFAEHDEHQADA